MVAERKRITINAFERLLAQPENAARHLELLNGELIERMPTEEHGVIAALVAAALVLYVRGGAGGRVAVEPRHSVPDDRYTSLIPDVAYTSAERMQPTVKKDAVPHMPDLAVEIKSPDDSYIPLREKVLYYLKHGARLVWLIVPEKQVVEVFTADAPIEVLGIDDTLSGGDVLPNFTLAVQAIFNT
jgi:Uma2 family endonuclease